MMGLGWWFGGLWGSDGPGVVLGLMDGRLVRFGWYSPLFLQSGREWLDGSCCQHSIISGNCPPQTVQSIYWS
ncbi:hypothetical protein QBC39DRAFT_346234 [Podospora conica]|nr:hypothetical protein QBC39DRAFT_346234 [Schizothecium conicum]